MIEPLTAANYIHAADLIKKKFRQLIPVEISRLMVTEWAEEHRVLTQGFCPGPFSFDVTPYLREIADCLSPSIAVREVGLMKGSRMGATTGIGENWLGSWIASGQGPFGYASADAESAGAQMELKIDELINSAGLGDLIGVKNNDKRKNQRTTGDRVLRKKIPGGYILAGGPNAAYFKRQFGFKGFYGDEIDADAWEMAMKDGDKIALIRRRLSEFPDTYKALWTSSPKHEHNSNIYKVYKDGDQRKYYVPCKKCGHMQFLKWGKKDKPGGLRFSYDDDDRLIAKYNKDGKVIPGKSSVYYECEKCGAHWTNEDKDYFLPDKKMGGLAEWRPTAVSRRPGLRTYHLPTLYAPVGSVSWESAVIDFLAIKHEGFPKLEFQVWVNTFLGEPFEDRGERPKIEAMLTRQRTYKSGNLPEDHTALFLTLGADVQKDRIEAELVAWGPGKMSWSIQYYILPGDTEDLESQCWTALRSIISTKYNGMQPIFSGIDSGYRTDVVYSFCDSFDAGVYPVMGSDTMNRGKDYVKFFTVSDHDNPRVDINTNLLKQEIYQNLSKGQYESGEYPKGFCHFPADYTREHYNRLTAESRVMIVDKYGAKKFAWDAGSRRNEQLDCRVYALAMAYCYRQYLEEEFKAEVDDDDYRLTWSDFWEYLQNN